MAALSYDSETTTTSSTSDLTGGETVTDLDNSSVKKTIQIISDNASTSSLTAPEDEIKLELTVNDADSEEDGRTFYTNDSASWTVVNASNGHYSLTVSHASLFDELERDVDENVTVNVTTTFNASETDEESATITIYAQNGDDRSVEVISDSDVEAEQNVELTNESRRVFDDLSYATVESEEQITNNTTVSYVFANDSVAEKYTAAYDAASFSSGDYLYTMTATSEGRPVMVFDSSAGEERDAGYFAGGFDPSEDTHAVYYQNGGDHGENQQLDVIPQGDDADENYLELETSGNQKLGFWSAFKNFGFDAAQSTGFGTAP